MTKRLAILAAFLAVAACSPQNAAGPPPAVAMTEEALGHYCQMSLLEHPGPKAQVHLAGIAEPLFFSQVRDAIAYQRMPEQSHAITAIYVSDMGAAPSWELPGADNWISADSAVYVIGATIVGGMGAPELVPFSTEERAQAFIAEHGGMSVALEAVPDAMVLAPVEFELDEEGNFLAPHDHSQTH
jgi:copper chaperone NosL